MINITYLIIILNYYSIVYSTIRLLINIKKYIQICFILVVCCIQYQEQQQATSTTPTTIRNNNNNNDDNNDDDDDDEREKSGRQYIDRYVYF